MKSNTSESKLPKLKVATRPEWLESRREILKLEKALTKEKDRISALRRRAPVVKVEKNYLFEGKEGVVPFQELFQGRAQLLVMHFMFDPEWEKGCPGCTGHVECFGDLSLLEKRDTTFVLISRAPFEKLEKYRQEKGWNLPWYSSFENDFNFDFHITFDRSKLPIEWNFENEESLIARGVDVSGLNGEASGWSVFYKVDDEIFHSYTTYARGAETLVDTYSMLDLTPLGRQEDWEDSPDGWPQNPTYG